MAKHARRCNHLSFGLLFFLLIAGCAPAKVTSTWRDPSLTGPFQFKKIVVLAIHPDRITRHNVEDEMVRQIGPERAVAGYTFISDDELKQVAVVKSKIHEQGFDGAVVLKLAGARSQTANAGTGDIRSFSAEYDSNVANMSESGSSARRTVVSVETDIYSVADEKLLWRGTTDLYDPHDAMQIVADVAKVVGAELRKEKLIS
jgi:hypothetical protein